MNVPAGHGETIESIDLIRGDEVGFICIQNYGANLRVAEFLPGYTLEYPGDTPKLNPDRDEWFKRSREDKARARFDEWLTAAAERGWRRPKPRPARSAVSTIRLRVRLDVVVPASETVDPVRAIAELRRVLEANGYEAPEIDYAGVIRNVGRDS